VENPLLMAAVQGEDAIGEKVNILRNTKYKVGIASARF
jgi:hypothetical protein